MVYESDFYTSRRPYSSTRPTVTSYSVTRREVPWHKVPNVPRPSQVPPCFTVFGSRSVPSQPRVKLPGLGRGQTFHRNVPAVGHKRIVVISPLAHSVRSRPSVIIGEMDRIYHKVRPSLAYQPMEDYLNSHSYVSFDDETRSIRAQTADLLRRIHTPVPRAQRPLPLPGEVDEITDDWYDSYDWYPEELGQTRLRLKLLSLRRDLAELGTGAYYSHSELPITDRITSDTYIDRMLTGTRNVARDINIMSHYEEPARHYNNIGQGHLACMSFAGGRPISKRRNLASDDYVRNDINVLSRYGRLRAAAAAAATTPTEPAYEPPVHRPPTKTFSGSWKSNAPRNPNRDSTKSNLTAGQDFDAAQERKQSRREAVEAAAQREVDEEKRRQKELNIQEELAQKAAAEREAELERKARELEEEAARKAEEDRLEAERLAKEEEERLLREEEERLAAEEQRLIEEEEARKKQEEEEKKAKKAKKEAERKAKEEEERKAKEEAERIAREEEERKAKEEAERIAREEAEKRAAEEAERKAREEEEKKAAEEAERIAREEAERKAKEEEERLLKEEEDRAKAEAERLANEATSEEKVPDESAALIEAEVTQSLEAESTEDAPVVEEPIESQEEPPAIEAEEVVSEGGEE